MIAIPDPICDEFAQQGKIPVSKMGNQWRLDREEIDAWVEAQRPQVKVKR